MDMSKLTTNNKIAGIGGVVSLINLFLPWYGGGFWNINGWSSGIFAWGGALLAVAGGALIVLKALEINEVKAGSFETEQLAMILAGVGTAFILLKLIFDNDLLRLGIFLGLIAAAVTAYGAFASGKDVGVGIPGADDLKRDDGPTTTF